jgi:hypothetical protein
VGQAQAADLTEDATNEDGDTTMMWLTWRQFRLQASTAAVILVGAAIALLVTGPRLANLYDSTGVASCRAHGDCIATANQFLTQAQATPYKQVYLVILLLILVVPALIGIFWGAPLIAREIETGTFRMAWNQSVTRRRWFMVKVGGVGLAAVATAGLLTLGLTWWVSPVYRAIALSGPDTPLSLQRFSPPIFDGQGLVPLGYAAFALLLGITAGLFIRRTIPAMAVTLAVFVVVQVVWGGFIRPHLIAPLHAVYSFASIALQAMGSGPNNRLFLVAGGKSGEWILGSHPIDAAGHTVSYVPAACLKAFNGPPNAFPHCLSHVGIKMAVTYQPASRFWDFQLLETGIFVAAAVLLAWLCLARVSRRLA